MRDSVELATRLVGGVWGHLVGDATGVPYEFTSADQVAAKGVRFGASGTHGQPPGTWLKVDIYVQSQGDPDVGAYKVIVTPL